MDIAACSALLHRRYKKCIPLLGVSRRPHRGQIREGNTIDDDDVAFLSSVKSPTELYLSLACLAWRRTGEDPLLVFVPFEEPREEVFSEIPLNAFIDERNDTHSRFTGDRKNGMCMVSLNEHSFLCSNVKDGLPPRRGLFITFRTSEASQRFRDAFDNALHREFHTPDLYPPQTAQHNSPRLSYESHSNTAIRYRRDRGEASPVRPQSSTGAPQLLRAPPVRETENFINSLLAERDRRREAYFYNAGASSNGSGNDFNEWAQAHQLSHPLMWNTLAGAAERKKMEVGEKRPVDSACDQISNGMSSLEERSILLCDLREAMKAFDQMSSTDISLMGAAREFLRQHQDDLWSIEYEKQRKKMAGQQPPAPQPCSHKDAGCISVPASSSLAAGIPLDSVTLKPVSATMSSSLVPPNSLSNLTVPHSVDRRPPLIQEVSDFVPQHVPSKPILQVASPPPVQHVPQPLGGETQKDRMQEETERAMAIEARLVANVQKAPPKPMISKGVFGSAPKMSISQPVSQLSPTPNLGGSESSPSASVDCPESAIKERSSPPRCGEKWKPVRDPNTGKYYYVHKETKKTSWRIEDTFTSQIENVKNEIVDERKPDETISKAVNSETKCGPGWRPVVDPSTGRTYYVNGVTKAVTWKVMDTLDKTQDMAKPPKGTGASTEWAERQDPASGKTYYYNKKTKQTTWKRAETDLGPS